MGRRRSDGTSRGGAGQRSRGNRRSPVGVPYPVQLRLRVVQEVTERGVSPGEVAQAFGIGRSTVDGWVQRYLEGGVDALVPESPGRRAGAETPAQAIRRDAVVAVKGEHPRFGPRRIRDEIGRDQGLGISETEVRRILHEQGLIPEARPATGPREHPPRRFERAEPNQLWQSDIFTFLLRKHERLYLAGFMDDCSRYMVSHALAHHQRSALVMEALGRGIADYGPPGEMLTDQGRQYTAWRGETEFEEELRRHGIRHVKSRPQHPQTLGKIERFWKTLWDEFLSRTVFADFADCARRLALFIHAYNFQRPHQALGGLVPADRFFRAAPQVRAAIEKGVADNAMRLAREQPPRKPFYLVGRLGDRDLSIAATGPGLTVQVGNEEPQTIALPKEDDDGRAQASRRVQVEDRGAGDEGGLEDEAAREADAGLADGAGGPRRDGAPPLLARAERAERRDAGDRCDRGGEDLARHVLPAREPGAASDARGALAGVRGRWGEPVAFGEDRRAGEEGGAARAGEAARRAPLARDAAGDQAGSADDRCRAAAEEPYAPALEDDWEQAFDRLDEAGGDEPDDGAGGRRPAFDPDDGWRGRALRWDRKLAGADALLYGRPAEECDGVEAEVDVYADAPGARHGRGPVQGGPRGPGWEHDGERGGAAARPLAQPLPIAHAPWPRADARGTEPAIAGSTTDPGARGGALSGARAAAPGQRAADAAGRDDAPDDGRDERAAHGAHGPTEPPPPGDDEAGDDRSGEG